MPNNQTNRKVNEFSRVEQKNRPTQNDKSEAREHGLDKTIADSFPSSDPPSTIPNPNEDE